MSDNLNKVEEILKLAILNFNENDMLGVSDDTIMEKSIKQPAQALTTLINNEKIEARIDELERAYPYFRIEEVAYGTAPHYYTDRLKELEGDK